MNLWENAMEEWHVSDSEEEDYVGNTAKLVNTRLDALSALSRKDPEAFLNQHYIPKNLIDLYERIANEGFIDLHCHGSKCSVVRKEDEGENIPVALTVDNNNASTVTEDSTGQKKSPTSNEFDYKEELFETTVKFPRKGQKSGSDKCKKAKRVGTMENVINDLNRFRELNAQAIANQK